MNKLLYFLLNQFPYILLAVWTIYSIYLVWKAGKTPNKINIYVFESIPNVFTTLGILGTFLGITHGLLFFNTDSALLSKSISELLNGLKIAFLTSIAGIVGSLIFSQLVKWRLNTVDELAPKIKSDEAKALFQVIEKSQEVNNTLQRVLSEINTNNKLAIENNKQLISSILDTNSLLRDKFDEFARLLAENNAKALVDAMMRVIEDFNETFAELIGSLVSKNFEELNESVKNLNSWQKSNMQQMQTLIQLFNEASENMKLSSTRLANISKYTSQLIDNEGFLANLIKELQSVMVDDTQFVQITQKLVSAGNNIVTLSKSLTNTAEEYEETKKNITQWLNRERGVQETMILFTEKMKEFEVANLRELDTSFNKRLSTTFQSFDKLFKEYVEYLNNKAIKR